MPGEMTPNPATIKSMIEVARFAEMENLDAQTGKHPVPMLVSDSTANPTNQSVQLAKG
jgi:hypothetical protein